MQSARLIERMNGHTREFMTIIAVDETHIFLCSKRVVFININHLLLTRYCYHGTSASYDLNELNPGQYFRIHQKH